MLKSVIALTMLVAAASACESALDLIKSAEGFRSCTYVDTTGHKTICYGFNLDASGAKQKIESVGGDWNKIYNDGGCLSESQCTTLLEGEVKNAAASAVSVFGSQCSCIEAVLTDMTYNLGKAGIESFHTFISDIKAHEWSAAASDARDSLWCRQVGNRCTRDTGIIAQGCAAENQ
ncbi:uncharacterized protein MONBRDRAFT_38498 [Monosiga brevicollis MX1]|uniref:Lysozyme n=1 Tax=Monosiga brevicollis TaxID=81824 RepID=A9V884_MONBE|nr:uncharacterized protein MONBRDRAFT_38498 [Monosiga brevicollis MX1]EDQ86225.1 predicted protein [Monosiga brevicollis MX1]|eukprot:XP_001748895.1 hypothetical protein [Monosiga brevicollis MX1]